MPSVSVCIPTYNYAHFLGQAIESVLAQTHEDFELIVVDDVSHDDTPAVVERYLGDRRVRFVVNQKNIGLFANFNRCFELASGPYVKVLCADDWLDPRSLEDAVAVLDQHPEVNLVSSPGWLVDREGSVTGMLRAPFGNESVVDPRVVVEAHADWGNVTGMPSHVLIRRAAAQAAGGFDYALAPASDEHLWLKVVAGSPLGWVPEPRCFLRVHTTHTHSYGPDPTESRFLLWEDLARREPLLVDEAMLRRGLYGHARECMLYVVRNLMSLQLRRARYLMGLISTHVGWRRVLPRFARDLPRLAWAQLARVRALRSGHLVVYDPLPRGDRPLRELTTR